MRKVSTYLGVATILVGLASGSAYAWIGLGGGVGVGFHGVGVGFRGPGYGGWHAGAVGWGHVGCYGCGVYHPVWHPAATAAVVGTAAAVGAAAGAAAATQPVYAPPAYAYPVGATVPVLPAGCAYDTFSGVNYYDCAGTWYRPYFGSNGVYYQVAPAP